LLPELDDPDDDDPDDDDPDDEDPAPEPKLKLGLPPEFAVAVLVTVMSVPTPYTDCRTVDCADFTPEAIDETMMTSAIASAMPIAMMTVCFLRLNSSRRR
jgi:hypothetical protein